MDEPIDFERARNRRLPRDTFVELPAEAEPCDWLCQVFTPDGAPVPGRCGVLWGLDGVPGVTLTAAQCRHLSRALAQVADHLDAEYT